MTIKNSLISVAAATLIVAGVTGCGGSSGSSSSSSTPTTSGVNPSSFEAVDGKIMNALATGYYVDENNATQTVTMEVTKTSTNVVDGNVTKGSYAYSIPEDSNVTADMIRYVEFNATTALVEDGQSYPASFIDVDGSLDYNVSKDQAFTGPFTAPKGFKYVTPVSTMVMALMGDDITSPELNATLLANKIELIASKLNLTTDNMKNLDPTAEGAEEYGFVNAMLAASTPAELSATATALAALETNATNFGAVVSSLASNAQGDAKNLFISIKNQLEAGSLTTDDLASINFDLTRENDGQPVVNTASATAIGNVTDIELASGFDASDLLSTGDKISKTGEYIELDFAANTTTDTNATGTVDLYISVANPEANVEDTAKQDKLVIKISDVDIKKVGAATTMEVNGSKAKVSYEYYNTTTADGASNYKSMTNIDANNTLFGTAFDTDNKVLISSLIDAIETNATAELNITGACATSLTSGKIVDLAALVVDNDGLLQKVDDDNNPMLWSTTTVAGTGSAIAAEGKMLLNLRADMRGTTTAVNTAPAPTYVVQAISPDTNRSNYDLNTTHADLLDFNVTTANNDSNENNTTVTITLGAGLKDINLTEVMRVVELNGTANVAGAIEANSTTDQFTTITSKFTDEFGESNTSIIDVFVNAAPAKSGSYGTMPTTDVNGTWHTTGYTITNMYELNNTITLDTNLSISATDTNVTGAQLTTGNVLKVFFAADANNSDTNVTIMDPVNSDLNVTVTGIKSGISGD